MALVITTHAAESMRQTPAATVSNAETEAKADSVIASGKTCSLIPERVKNGSASRAQREKLFAYIQACLEEQ